MIPVGASVEVAGRLLRDSGGFLLRSDQGETWRLVLHRVPVDHVEKRVCVSGVHKGDGVLEAEGVRPA